MKTNDMKYILKTKNQDQLIGETVITTTHDPIGGYFYKGDELEIINVVGSMLKVKNNKNKSNCLISMKRVELKNELKLKTYCISCNTPYKNTHLTNCATFMIEDMISSNKEVVA